MHPTKWIKRLHKDYNLCRQTDGHSCGILAAITAAYYIQTGVIPNQQTNFDMQDIPHIRQYMQFIMFKYRDASSSISTITLLDDDDM